jgi:hypothetical protein
VSCPVFITYIIVCLILTGTTPVSDGAAVKLSIGGRKKMMIPEGIAFEYPDKSRRRDDPQIVKGA